MMPGGIVSYNKTNDLQKFYWNDNWYQLFEILKQNSLVSEIKERKGLTEILKYFINPFISVNIVIKNV